MRHESVKAVPLPRFDCARLDRLMEEAGLDVVLATSRHNVQYLLGGYRCFFFESIEALGTSRYLPIVVYPKGRPDDALYVGSIIEKVARERNSFWTPHVVADGCGSTDAMAMAVEHLKRLGRPPRRIGIEAAFLPADARDTLAAGIDGADIVDAHRTLERLRAIKTPDELALVRAASDGVVDAMVATFAAVHAGMTKHDIVARLRQEQFARGIDFNFCQIAIGPSFDRVPSDQVLQPGEVVSLDSGANLEGYVGDLCRMGVAGEADAELVDILADIDRIQQAARAAICAGVVGGELITAGDAAVKASPHASAIDFTVHGLGLVNHEAPRLATGRPLPYPADDAELPLEAGMVISVETSVRHPTRGFIKLEDTLTVTASGSAAYGDHGRGWNRIAAAGGA
jgi:Xaa-Pro aminopeptidase